jgi:hypothetical protein
MHIFDPSLHLGVGQIAVSVALAVAARLTLAGLAPPLVERVFARGPFLFGVKIP